MKVSRIGYVLFAVVILTIWCATSAAQGERDRGRGMSPNTDVWNDAPLRPTRPNANGKVDGHRDRIDRGDPHFGMRAGGGPGRSEPLTEDEINELIEIARDISPRLAERIESVKRDNPSFFMQTLRRIQYLRPLAELKKANPEMYGLKIRDMRLNYETMAIAMKINKMHRTDEGSEADKEELTVKLRARLKEHFEVRQELLEAEVAALEKRISDMRESLQHRAENMEILIEDRIKELTIKRERPRW